MYHKQPLSATPFLTVRSGSLLGQRDQADQPEEHRAHAHETDKDAAVLHTILPFVIPPPGNSAPPLAEYAPACVGGKVLWLSYHAGAEKQRVL